MPTGLHWETIRFAAKCAINQEPMLLAGALVQLGKTKIFPYTDQAAPSVDEVDVACARITAFRDQLDGDWEQFSGSPVKWLLSLLPPLQTCRVQPCDCSKGHVDQAMGDRLLDVFRRQYFTDGGKPTKREQASRFSVQVRYLKKQEFQLFLPSAGSQVSTWSLVHQMQCPPAVSSKLCGCRMIVEMLCAKHVVNHSAVELRAQAKDMG